MGLANSQVFQPQPPFRDFKRLTRERGPGVLQTLPFTSPGVLETLPRTPRCQNALFLSLTHAPKATAAGSTELNPDSQPAKQNILIFYLHANADHVAGGVLELWSELLKHNDFCHNDLALIAPEYPGYCPDTFGEVKPDAETTQRACLEVFRSAKKRYPRHRCVVIGRSLGSNLATWLARKQPFSIHTLVLLCPFLSIRHLAPTLLAPLVSYDYLNTERNLRHLIHKRWKRGHQQTKGVADTMMVLLVHGERDTLVPPSHSRQLLHMLQSRRVVHSTISSTLVMEKEATHNHLALPLDLLFSLISENPYSKN